MAARAKAAERIVVTRNRRLTSPTNIKKFLLEYAKDHRAHKFTRVSKARLDEAEANMRLWCERVVTAAPSCGQTL